LHERSHDANSEKSSPYKGEGMTYDLAFPIMYNEK